MLFETMSLNKCLVGGREGRGWQAVDSGQRDMGCFLNQLGRQKPCFVQSSFSAVVLH